MAKKRFKTVAVAKVRSEKGRLTKKKVEVCEVGKYFKQWIYEGADPNRWEFIPCSTMRLLEAAEETRKALAEVLMDKDVPLDAAFCGVKAAAGLAALMECLIDEWIVPDPSGKGEPQIARQVTIDDLLERWDEERE